MTEEKCNTKDKRHIDEKSQEYIAKGNRMTEEIIVDGVNVTGCEYQETIKGEAYCYCIDARNCEGYITELIILCEEHPKCQYKVKTRLEQENNSLQAQLNNITVQSNNAITALEQENAELKAYKDINEDFKKAWDELNEKYKQLRSALEEIREKIKSLNKDICNNCGWNNTDNCQPNGYVCHDLIEIKNKINEVLNDK